MATLTLISFLIARINKSFKNKQKMKTEQQVYDLTIAKYSTNCNKF